MPWNDCRFDIAVPIQHMTQDVIGSAHNCSGLGPIHTIFPCLRSRLSAVARKSPLTELAVRIGLCPALESKAVGLSIQNASRSPVEWMEEDTSNVIFICT